MIDTGAPIRDNLARVRERIAAACRAAGRDPAEVTLVAVSKTHPAALVAEAVRAGVQHLGENRVQEAAGKVPAVAALLGDNGAPTWHMIGHLQTNKAKQVVGLFHVVESVDSVRLAAELEKRAAAAGSRLPVLLEVYVGGDAGRPGLRPSELLDAAGAVLELPHLEVRGLMTVAPLGWDTAATRGAFAQVRQLKERLDVTYPRVHWSDLSMGMSDDFELAIAEGSTAVRVGRAIFGARER